jgi:hypothetical protein
MKQIFTIIFLILTTSCFGQHSFDMQKISEQTERIVAKIAIQNRLDGAIIGVVGGKTEQYGNFAELQKKATRAELTALTGHPNTAIRCYAFWALSCDSTADLLPIVISHLDDTALVYTQFGCIVSQEKAGDFFFDVTRQSIDLNSKKLTPEEYGYLDSVLIYTPNKLYARNRAIDSARLTEAFYRRTKELVLKENSQSALIALAKFRRKEDIPLILKSRLAEDNHGPLFFYMAICEFPDQAFRPLLKESLHDALSQSSRNSGGRGLYNAIASFKDDTAYQLLQEPFTKIKDESTRKSHINLVFDAIRKYYSPAYNGLLWDIWENEKKISPDVFSLLYQQQPEKAFQLTKKAIQHSNDFYYLSDIDNTVDGKQTVNLLDIMLDTVLVRDSALAVGLINENIRNANVHLFGTYADKASKLKHNSCVEALFARLEKEDNPNVYLIAAEVLIAFGNENINRQIVEVSKRNGNMREGWGGDAFVKLLKEHDIGY